MTELLEKIRKQTLPAHEALENSLRLMERCVTREEYLKVLKKFYGFYFPLGEKIKNQASADTRSVQALESLRKRIEWLIEDFKAFDLMDSDIQKIEQCPEVPSLDNSEQALGFCYVLEGSTLGGQVIRRHFKYLWKQEDDSGLRFFGAYGAETGPRWRAFVQNLQESGNLLSESEGDQVLRGANQMFEKLGVWFKS